VVVSRDAWDVDKIPPHLRLSFRIVDSTGTVVGEGKDLARLRDDLRDESGAAISAAAATVERAGLTTWDFDELPRTVVVTRAGHEVRGYPALVEERHSDGSEPNAVAIRVLATEGEQVTATRIGVRRLLVNAVPAAVRDIVGGLTNQQRLTLGLAPHPTIPAVLEDAYAAAVDEVMLETSAGLAWNRAEFDRLVDAVRREGPRRTDEVVQVLLRILPAAHDVHRRLSGRADLSLLPALSDMKGQWERLLHPGFVAAAGLARLRHYPRYLSAMDVRLDKLHRDPGRDAVLMATVAGVQSAYLDRIGALPGDQPPSEALRDIAWMIEELRVSTWAQELKTAQPISVQRVEKALRDL
jgi:ATP-dependent helicase HrpA